MAKKPKKKPAYSTKKWVEPVEPTPDPEPVVEPPKPGKLTLEEAIAEFKKNPREETFWIPPEYPQGQAIAAGNAYIKFEKGFFKTSDPAEVEAIMRSVGSGITYNMHIFAMSPELRNLKK